MSGERETTKISAKIRRENLNQMYLNSYTLIGDAFLRFTADRLPGKLSPPGGRFFLKRVKQAMTDQVGFCIGSIIGWALGVLLYLLYRLQKQN